MEDLPYPPLELAARVGELPAENPYGLYDWIGADGRRAILDALPPGWSWEGRRVLDFGCGAGRTLRQFGAEVDAGADLWGCDIDAASVDWLATHASPPFTIFRCAESPPLDVPDAHFDLAYAISVFTHLDAGWAEWLLELRRVLRPGGVLIASFMGEGMVEEIAGERWDERRIGMNPLRPGNPWAAGGPMVLHSPWWLRAHWGRAFEVLSVAGLGVAHGDPRRGHGLIALRRPDTGAPAAAELRAPQPGEPREQTSAAALAEQLAAEARALRAEVEALRRRHDTLTSSRSWRLTRPLRAVARRLKK